MPENINERWVSLQDICDHLGVKRYTVMKWLSQKNMPAVKVGRLWKFKISEVDEWVRAGGASD